MTLNCASNSRYFFSSKTPYLLLTANRDTFGLQHPSSNFPAFSTDLDVNPKRTLGCQNANLQPHLSFQQRLPMQLLFCSRSMGGIKALSKFSLCMYFGSMNTIHQFFVPHLSRGRAALILLEYLHDELEGGFNIFKLFKSQSWYKFQSQRQLWVRTVQVFQPEFAYFTDKILR